MTNAKIKKIQKKALLIGLAILVLLLIATFIVVHFNNASSLTEKPHYKTISPYGRSVSDFGGWKRVSPPEEKSPIFSYSDEIDAVPINVTQQELPEDFTDNLDQKVADLAKAYGSTSLFDASGTKVYIGTSAKGPQSVIFTKNDLLVFILSETTIEKESWVKYVTSLE